MWTRFYAARRPGPCPGKVLMLQADGKGIAMLPAGAAPGGRRAAGGHPPGRAVRPAGPRPQRMAEVVSVSDVTPVPRTARGHPARPVPRRRGKRPPSPTATGTWLNASVTDDIPAMISAMFDEAERRDPAHARTWIALVDGNNQQIDEITGQARPAGITVTILIDFVHVMGYLHQAARALHEADDPAAITWADRPGPHRPDRARHRRHRHHPPPDRRRRTRPHRPGRAPRRPSPT